MDNNRSINRRTFLIATTVGVGTLTGSAYGAGVQPDVRSDPWNTARNAIMQGAVGEPYWAQADCSQARVTSTLRNLIYATGVQHPNRVASLGDVDSRSAHAYSLRTEFAEGVTILITSCTPSLGRRHPVIRGTEGFVEVSKSAVILNASIPYAPCEEHDASAWMDAIDVTYRVLTMVRAC